MARTTTRDIIKVCAELARMDKKAKEEVYAYLKEELKIGYVRFARPGEVFPHTASTEPAPATYPEGGEQ